MSLALDANVVLALEAQETVNGVRLVDSSGVEGAGISAFGSPLALQTGPCASVLSRFADGFSGKYFSSITTSSAWIDAVQNQYTFWACYSPKNIASGTVRTLYALSSGTAKYLWLVWEKDDQKFLIDWKSGGVEQALEFPIGVLGEDAWYFLAIRKTVTSGTTRSDRISKIEFWHRPIASLWGSDVPDNTATGQLNSDETDAPNNSVGAYWQGSAAFFGDYGVAGIRGSNNLRDVAEIRAAFEYYKTGVAGFTPPDPGPVTGGGKFHPAIGPVGAADIGLKWGFGAADVSVANGDIVQDGGLSTSVFLSLFTDRRANDGDILPPGETSRRGWWGDEFSDNPNDRIGSRLWLLSRAKQTQETLTAAKGYCVEALQWMLEDLVADSVDVTAEYVGRGLMVIEVSITRPNVDPTTFRYNYNWSTQEAQAQAA